VERYDIQIMNLEGVKMSYRDVFWDTIS